MGLFLALVIAAWITGLVVLLFLVMVVGIHREPAQMQSDARGVLAGLTRRLLGVAVVRPAAAGSWRRGRRVRAGRR
jgi:hypothetical protein